VRAATFQSHCGTGERSVEHDGLVENPTFQKLFSTDVARKSGDVPLIAGGIYIVLKWVHVPSPFVM
jgi:hypothetical protein